MSEHKQCPACGAGAQINSELTVYPVAGCTNPDCFLYGLAFHIEEWDALRPIEDALRAELARLQTENENLIDDIRRLELGLNS